MTESRQAKVRVQRPPGAHDLGVLLLFLLLLLLLKELVHDSESCTRSMRVSLLSVLVLGASPAMAQGVVEPAIHKLCVEAKDYAGCVKAMTGEKTSADGPGNRCPSGFAYVGGSKECQKVDCKYRWWMFAGGMKHNPVVAGKSSWNCPDQWSGGTLNKGVLTLNDVGRTEYDPNCPPTAPEIGWNNSCEQAPKDWRESEEAKARLAKSKCNIVLKAYGCSYSAYLNANPGMKKWAELNPGLAAEERAKLQSVD